MTSPNGNPIVGHVTPVQGNFDALRDKLNESVRAAQEALAMTATVETGTATMPEALRCVIALAHAFAGHAYQISLGPVSDEMFAALLAAGATTRSTYYEADGTLYTKPYVIEVAELTSGGVEIHGQVSHEATAREKLAFGTARL
jgi:hypothetical protein